MMGYQERLEGLAEVASAALGGKVKVLDMENATAYGPGFRLLELDECFIDVYPMLFTWRLGRLRRGERLPGVFWCYEGAGTLGLIRACRAARMWQGDPGSEPEGWVRRGYGPL